jgi:hypothetical protein
MGKFYRRVAQLLAMVARNPARIRTLARHSRPRPPDLVHDGTRSGSDRKEKEKFSSASRSSRCYRGSIIPNPNKTTAFWKDPS